MDASSWQTVPPARRRKPSLQAAPSLQASPPQPSALARALAPQPPGAVAAAASESDAVAAATSDADDDAGDDARDDSGEATLGPGGVLFLRAGSPPLDTDVSEVEGCDVDADGAAADVASARGAGWGRVPNLWWRAPRRGSLRRHARFVALPPVAELALAGEASLSFLRQDSPAWADAHAGRLTGGALLAALGCREPNAARRLGLPRAAAGRAHAAAAAARLRQPQALQLQPADAAAVAAAAAHNAAAVAAYNARLAASEAVASSSLDTKDTEDEGDDASAMDADGGNVDEEHAAGGGAAAAAAAVRRRAKPRGGKKGARGSRRAPAAASSAAVSSAATSAAGSDARIAAAAAAAGGAAVRCAWGSAQECGTLFAFLSAFPEAQLHEAGLCALRADVAADVAAAAGGGTLPADALAHLPPLGASPDALLRWVAPSAGGGGWAPPARGARPGWEVVEVKNVCPFREAAPPAQNKRHAAPRRRAYALSDQGPQAALPAAHVPQLQLEMAAADVASGLLVVESATKGMAVWRLPRDDAYLAAMLALLAAFNRLYGAAPGAGPLPASPHADLFPNSGADGGLGALHAAFVRRTAALAAEAQMLDFIAAPRRPPDADARPFLD